MTTNREHHGFPHMAVHATADMVRVDMGEASPPSYRSLDVMGPGTIRVVSIFVEDRETAAAIRDAGAALLASFPEPEEATTSDTIDTVAIG